jgi:hypothetical protein
MIIMKINRLLIINPYKNISIPIVVRLNRWGRARGILVEEWNLQTADLSLEKAVRAV